MSQTSFVELLIGNGIGRNARLEKIAQLLFAFAGRGERTSSPISLLPLAKNGAAPHFPSPRLPGARGKTVPPPPIPFSPC